MRHERGDNLPVQTTSFIDRVREVPEVEALLERSRLVTLTGVGGVGKARLALRVAERAVPRFRDGVWLVELSPLHEPFLLAHTIGAAIGLEEQAARPQQEVLAGFIADKEMLIVLDTCEHLAPACAELADRLPAAAPGVRLLATSRSSLGHRAERLDDRFRVLGGTGQEAPPRHATMRTAISWSHELCEPLERLLWARLSVFCGPFDVADAREVCAGPGLRAGQVEELLAGLVDKSIVLRHGNGYSLLDTLREYGAEWLDKLGERTAVRRRHRDHYLVGGARLRPRLVRARPDRAARPGQGGPPQLPGGAGLLVRDARRARGRAGARGPPDLLLDPRRPALGGTAPSGTGPGVVPRAVRDARPRAGGVRLARGDAGSSARTGSAATPSCSRGWPS